MQHLELSTKKKKPQLSVSRAVTFMKDTKLSSLSVRVGEPYWLVHQGNCEHFCVVDQIRYAVIFVWLLRIHRLISFADGHTRQIRLKGIL